LTGASSRCKPKGDDSHRRAGRRTAQGQQGHQLGQGNHQPAQLQKDFDAVLLTGGSEQSRDLPVPGRDLDGIHFAMEFLPQQNKVNAGDKLKGQLRADGKHVIVIGGGDTGSDCVGTSNRHGAASVTQFEVMPQPPVEENRPLTWPYWPLKLRTSSSHDEGCVREFAISTKEFIGEKGKVTGLKTVRVEWKDGKMVEVARHRAGTTRPTWCCWPWVS
jgi:glutamate synthase (NADPH/NADH) small chain